MTSTLKLFVTDSVNFEEITLSLSDLARIARRYLAISKINIGPASFMPAELLTIGGTPPAFIRRGQLTTCGQNNSVLYVHAGLSFPSCSHGLRHSLSLSPPLSLFPSTMTQRHFAVANTLFHDSVFRSTRFKSFCRGGYSAIASTEVEVNKWDARAVGRFVSGFVIVPTCYLRVQLLFAYDGVGRAVLIHANNKALLGRLSSKCESSFGCCTLPRTLCGRDQDKHMVLRERIDNEK